MPTNVNHMKLRRLVSVITKAVRKPFLSTRSRTEMHRMATVVYLFYGFITACMGFSPLFGALELSQRRANGTRADKKRRSL